MYQLARAGGDPEMKVPDTSMMGLARLSARR